MRARSAWAASLAALSLSASATAWAQYPPQPGQEPYPPPPTQQPYPAPAPAPQTPYPAPAPPPLPAPPQQPYAAPYGQPPPGYVQPGAYPPPPVMMPAYAPPRNRYRSPGEMAYLFGTGVIFGLGTGIWIDAVGHITDPGIAVIPPLAFGAAVPIGLYLWDQNDEFDRGVASSIGTGILLGGLEGVAISGLQWQLTGNGGPSSWGFPTWTSVTFLTAAGGGIGGYAFGEWFQPDPRTLGFIASGAGLGAINGFLFGSGAVNGDWKDGAAVWGFVGYNAGILLTGALSTVYVPSWQTQKYMWLGDILGTLATTPVYLFYVGNSADPRHGLIANAVGGLAGIGIALALTANMTDGGTASAWTPPVQIAVGPTPYGGAQITAYGQF